MALIDVTIDVRDFDPTSGPAPAYPSVTVARLSPSSDSGVLVTTNPVPVPLTGGHGVVTLRTATAYLIRCLAFGGFAGTFAVMTGTTPTTLADLWKTGQIDPGTFAATPVPQTVEQALAAQAASVAATYVALRGPWTASTAFPKNSLVIQAGAVYLAAADVPARSVFTSADWQALGGAATPAPVASTDNGDGTFTITGVDVTDNGDGTFTSTGTVTDNGDGTFALAA